MTRLEKKIAEIQKYRDEQATQLASDIKGWTTIKRVQYAFQIAKIEDILHGLDIALEILKKK